MFPHPICALRPFVAVVLAIAAVRTDINWILLLVPADTLAASNARYRAGFDMYLQDGDPRGRASVIIDNTDPQHPVRVFRDFC